MDFLIIGLSLLIFLVNGSADSQPESTEGQVFSVEFDMAPIKSLEILSTEQISFWGWDVKLEPSEEKYLQIKIPKNLPIPGEKFGIDEAQWFKPGHFSGSSKTDILHVDYSEDSCYRKYSVDIENQTKFTVGWEINLMGEGVLHSRSIPDGCGDLGFHNSQSLISDSIERLNENRITSNDSNPELIGVIGLMIRIIVVSIGVGFYSMRKKF